MDTKQIIVLALLFLISLYIVLQMIATYKLREVYAVIWVLVILTIPASVILFPYIKYISMFLGIPDPFYLVVFGGFMICFVLLLHFSALNSGMQRGLKNSIQKIAIMEEELRHIREIIHKKK